MVERKQLAAMNLTSFSAKSPIYRSYAPFDIVVMAASLGGLQAVSNILAALPADFPVPIVLVQHLSPNYKSQLAEILCQRTLLQVEWAMSGVRLQAGHVYIAPPDWHVQVTRFGTLKLTQTPKVQFTRPSADPLFQSVAQWYGKRAIAVVLTGGGSDGAMGVRAIKAAGGRVFVEHPHAAQAIGMPQAALATGCVDFALSLRALAPALVAFIMVRGAVQFFASPSVA